MNSLLIRQCILILSIILLPFSLKAQELHGLPIMNSGAVGLNGKMHYCVWYNTLGIPIYIASLEVWEGEDGGTFSDNHVLIYRMSDGNVLVNHGNDHYADHGGAMETTWNQKLSPFYVTLAPGDALIMQCRGSHTGGNNGVVAYAVTLFYTTDHP